MREVPPVVDTKGEFTEVQVLEEGGISILINSWINWINTPPNPSYVLVTRHPCVTTASKGLREARGSISIAPPLNFGPSVM